MASTAEDLIRASSVDRTGKELMDTSDFCDDTRGLEVEYDDGTSTENNVGYPDLLDKCSREKGDIHKKDLKLICLFLTLKQCILGRLLQLSVKMLGSRDLLLRINFTFHSSGGVDILLVRCT